MLNFKNGRVIARIKKKKEIFRLKIEDPNYDSGDDDEDIGDVKHNFSFTEKLTLLTKAQLKEAIDMNPNIKLRLQQELNNDKCPYRISNDGKSISDIKGARFMFTFDPHVDREVIYIFAKSGAGKSVLCRKYIKEYLLENPDNTIFLFSLKDEDPAFDDIENLSRIPIDTNILNAVDLDSVKNSLVIFDDTETDKKTDWSTELTRIKDEIVQRGRSKRIFCIITTHMAANFNKTRVILNEADKLVSFPGRVSNSHFKYFYEKHGGLDPIVVKRMLALRSRWVCYDRNYPQNIVHEHGAFVVDR
jgi:hypothetical protein